MPDDIQQQIDSLMKSSQGTQEPVEDEFLKEERDHTDETHLPAGEAGIAPDGSDSSDEDKGPQKREGPAVQKDRQTKTKPLYERAEDGEIDFKNKTKTDEPGTDDVPVDRIKPAPAEKEEILGEKIKEIEVKKKEEGLKSKAVSLGQGYINLKGLPIVPEALRLVSEEESKREGIICFMYKGKGET